MKLPEIILELLLAAENFDSAKYADCFSENAIVFDEGSTHSGKKKIEEWNAGANKKYSAMLEPVSCIAHGGNVVMTTKVSGNFAGSPIILKYHLRINNGQIDYLKITG